MEMSSETLTKLTGWSRGKHIIRAMAAGKSGSPMTGWFPATLWGYVSAMSFPSPGSRRVQRERLGALAIMATGFLFIWRSLADLPIGTIRDPGPAAMPLLLAGLLVVSALACLDSARAGLIQDGDSEDVAEPGHVGHAVRVVAAIAVAALALGPLGYPATILALLVFFLVLVERKPIIIALIVSFALSFGSYALFRYVLKLDLPAGPFGF
jgi:hypothetical protein